MTAGPKRIEPSQSKPPRTYSKLDVMRTRSRVGVASLPPDWATFTQTHGWGDLGPNHLVRIFSPDDVVSETERWRSRKLAIGPSDDWMESDRSSLIALGSALSGPIVWIPRTSRYVTLPASTEGYPVHVLGATFDDAIWHVFDMSNVEQKSVTLVRYEE